MGTEVRLRFCAHTEADDGDDMQQPDLPDVLVPPAVLDRYGYLKLVGVVMVESSGIPAPGQTILRVTRRDTLPRTV